MKTKKYLVDVDRYNTVCFYKWGSKGKVLHREDGPAVEYANGTKFWYLNGKRHREDGPAIVYSDGVKSYHYNGKCFSLIKNDAQWKRHLKLMKFK